MWSRDETARFETQPARFAEWQPLTATKPGIESQRIFVV